MRAIHGGYPDPPSAYLTACNAMFSKAERDAIVRAALEAHRDNFESAEEARIAGGYGGLSDPMW